MIATADPKPRIAARAVLALALFAFLVFEVVKHGHWAPALVGMLGPDIALLGGMGGGRLNPRAVPLYNVLHMYWLPVALMAVAATGVIALGWFVLVQAPMTPLAGTVVVSARCGVPQTHGAARRQ